MTEDANWHILETGEVQKRLHTGSAGLDDKEAGRRLETTGPNTLAGKKKISPWMLFLEQFKSFLIIILLVAVLLSAILGETADAILIFIIVVFAGGLGFVQEYRAEKALEALREVSAPVARVIRGGREREVPSAELVPGDVIVLKTGDRIPADGRLLEAVNLKTEEASLTGESAPIQKTSQPLSENLAMADRKNMVYMGTSAVYGRGKAIVTATGMQTEFGKIATLIQEIKQEQTPLQINLDRVGKYIGIAALVLCFSLAGIGVARGHEILEMFIWGIALAVAAVPEALPAVVVISLALGVRRMARRNALVRRLPAVETLGSTDYICSDKTGTLTQDRMTVQRLFISGVLYEVSGNGYEPSGKFFKQGVEIAPIEDELLQQLLQAGALCNDAILSSGEQNLWTVKGDPTEGALVVAAAKAGLDAGELNLQYPRLGEVPFSSETKKMTTFHRAPDGVIAYSKGAAEVILQACSHVNTSGGVKVLEEADREEILANNRQMAGEALRVLGMAFKHLPVGSIDASEVEQGMVFAGMAGMIDPPRDEARQSIQTCRQAGIKSVMITGDHRLTAIAIARELGLFDQQIALTGTELDRLDDRQFEEMVERIEVYARVSPSHKLRVVEALTKRGHVVAMTGDGINDAPALKKADIGIAMGINGTDVTRESADMVLTDDNFASIVNAIEEGRIIFGNIKKYLMYLLSSNIGEVLLMAGAILLGPVIGLPEGAIPLIAVQILFVNLVTDGLPAIALSIDPADPEIMSQKPRPRGQGVFTRPVLLLMAGGGLWSFLVNLGVFKWALDYGKDMLEAQTMCFITLVLIQFFKAYNFRSDTRSVFKIGIFKNRWLNISVVSQIALLLLIVYIPVLQEPFNTYPLDWMDWLIVLLAAGSVFPVLELLKLVTRRYRIRHASRPITRR